MFNAEQMLGNLLQDTLSDTIGFGGRRKKGKKKRKRRGLGGFGKGALVGAGAAGLAALAYQHFSGKGQQGGGSTQWGGVNTGQAQAPPPLPPQPAASAAAIPPPAPGATSAPPAPAPSGPPPAPPTPIGQDDALALIQAMVAAAAADGTIDADEREHILAKLDRTGTDEEGRRQMEALLDSPPTLKHVVRSARSPQLAEQIYAVSCLAIDVDTDAERRYLQTLGQTLGLSPDTVATLNDQLGVD
jgi:uncharacterized membrane protein YebE (DUF533 family)